MFLFVFVKFSFHSHFTKLYLLAKYGGAEASCGPAGVLWTCLCLYSGLISNNICRFLKIPIFSLLSCGQVSVYIQVWYQTTSVAFWKFQFFHFTLVDMSLFIFRSNQTTSNSSECFDFTNTKQTYLQTVIHTSIS